MPKAAMFHVSQNVGAGVRAKETEYEQGGEIASAAASA